jgi:hypothetical protein
MLAGDVLVPVMVTEPLCGPGETFAGFTLTLTTPGAAALAGLTVSQLASLVAVTVKFPEANTETLCVGSELSPCRALKLNDVGDTVSELPDTLLTARTMDTLVELLL